MKQGSQVSRNTIGNVCSIWPGGRSAASAADQRHARLAPQGASTVSPFTPNATVFLHSLKVKFDKFDGMRERIECKTLFGGGELCVCVCVRACVCVT